MLIIITALVAAACQAAAPLPAALSAAEYGSVQAAVVEEVNGLTLATSRLVAAPAGPGRNEVLLAEATAARDRLAALLQGLPSAATVPDRHRRADAALRQALGYYIEGMDRLRARAGEPRPEDEEFFRLVQEAGKRMHAVLAGP